MPQKSPLFIAFLVVLVDLIGFGMIIPVQPFYAESLGASATLVTLVGATYSAMQFLFAPLWGSLSDRHGRRIIILISILLTGLGHLLFACSGKLITLFLARALAGFGAANISTAQAIISDTTTPETRAKGMGMIGAAFGLGFIIGPAFGGYLSKFGIHTPAIGAAILCLLNFIFAFWLLPETLKPNSVTSHGIGEKIANLKKLDPTIKRFTFLTLIVTTAFAMMEQTIGLFIKYSGNTSDAPTTTAHYLVVVGITATIVQGMLVGKLAKRFGELSIIPLGMMLLVIGMVAIVALGHSGSLPLFFLTAIFLASGSGLFTPNVWSVISKKSASDAQGLNLSINQSSAALGRIFGPAAAGALFDLNMNLPFITAAALLIGSILIFYRSQELP